MRTIFYTRPATSSKSESSKGYYIFVDCQWSGGRTRKSTNIYVSTSEPFDEHGNLPGKGVEIQLHNTTLSSIRSKAAAIELEKTLAQKQLTKKELDVEIYKIVNPAKATKLSSTIEQTHKTDNFLVFLKEFCTSKPVHLQEDSLSSYRSFITVCEAYAKKHGKDIFRFDKINTEWRNSFSNFIFKECNHCFSTEDKWIKHIKTLMSLSLEGKYHQNTEFLLIKRASRKKLKNDNAIACTEQELNEMYALVLPPDLEEIRDLFVFNSRTGGLRISQNLALEKAHWKDNYLEIKKSTKTGNYVCIPLHWQAKAILKKYKGRLPKLPEQTINDGLKIIGQKIKSMCREEIIYTSKGGVLKQLIVPRYTLLLTHAARRTFCTLCTELGFNKSWIMEISGHETEDAFDLYVKAKDMNKRKIAEKVRAEMEKVGWV